MAETRSIARSAQGSALLASGAGPPLARFVRPLAMRLRCSSQSALSERIGVSEGNLVLERRIGWWSRPDAFSMRRENVGAARKMHVSQTDSRIGECEGEGGNQPVAHAVRHDIPDPQPGDRAKTIITQKGRYARGQNRSKRLPPRQQAVASGAR